MSNWIANRSAVLLFALLTILASAIVASSQTRPSSNLPGPGIREGNRAMDDYDRTLNRMKNDAKAASERRRNLFPQINEDFQRIQVIHNEIVRMLQPDKELNYDRLGDLTGDLKKRGARLRENLALPEPEKNAAVAAHVDPVDEAHMKKTIADLHDVVVSFVANPIFKNLGVVDARMVETARQSLDTMIGLSEEIKREAKMLGKSAKN
jgi:TolA-binding protein